LLETPMNEDQVSTALEAAKELIDDLS